MGSVESSNNIKSKCITGQCDYNGCNLPTCDYYVFAIDKHHSHSVTHVFCKLHTAILSARTSYIGDLEIWPDIYWTSVEFNQYSKNTNPNK